MNGTKQYEFFLLRYVPDAVQEEFATIAVALYEPLRNGAVSGGFAEVRLTRDWRRVRCMDPEADVEWLEALVKEIHRELGENGSRDTLLKKMQDSFSNLLQISPAKALLSADAATEVETLASIYLGTRYARVKREVSGRPWIVAQMRDALAQAEILNFMQQKFVVEPFTKKGDPMKLDFCYANDREIKFLQAVSLTPASVDQAVILASRFPVIAAGIQAKDKALAMLTAVVDHDLDLKNNEIGFALEMMQEKGLRVASVAEMPRIAEEIRRELRV
jgi:hypothetical protein